MKYSNKKIWKEIKKLGPGFVVPIDYFKDLENVNPKSKINSGFKIPENYFSCVEEKILMKIFKGTSNYSLGFKTPKNYFKNIDSKILVKTQFNKPFKLISMVKNNYISMVSFGIAASLLLFIGLNNYKSKLNEININSIEVTEIENWIKDDLISFNTYEITEAFSDVSLNFENYYTEDELLEYFINQDIENLILEN